MPTTTDFQAVRLHLPDDATSTLERRAGRPDVRRHFADLVVVAVSIEPAVATDVPSALGDVVAAYRGRRGYSRVAVAAPEVPGAVAKDAVEFEWTSDDSVDMVSRVVVAADADFVATVHVAYPRRFAERQRPLAERIISSLELTANQED